MRDHLLGTGSPSRPPARATPADSSHLPGRSRKPANGRRATGIDGKNRPLATGDGRPVIDGKTGNGRRATGTPLGLPRFGGHLSNGEDVHMARRKRRQYTPEYRAEAVRQVNLGDRTLAQVAKDLGLGNATLWAWVRQAEVDAGKGEPEELTTTEREELKRLRRENARLREEREILKKATAFFAGENK